MRHDLKIKPETIGWGAAILIGLVFAYPNIRAHQASTSLQREDITKREAKASSLERELEFEQRQAEVANKRYESCLPVVGEFIKNGTHYFTGLREGDVPTDRITGERLPTGTVLCDANGTTAVVGEDGTLGFLAYTGNRNIIQSRLNRFRGSQFSQPVIK